MIRPILFSFISAIMLLTNPALSAQNTIHDALDSPVPARTDITTRVGKDSDTTFLPVTVFKGKEPGPVFTIVAGIHGYEYPPIIAVQELINEIGPDKLKGNLIIVPIANVASFYARTPFISPIDGKNLNTVFPGSFNGSVSEQIAHIITSDIISRSDVFLDIHGGDAGEDLLPFICYYDNSDSPVQTAFAKKLCRVSGFENIVSYSYHITAQQPAFYAFKQAVQDGKTALSIESGKLGNVQPEAVVQIKKAIYNLLREMGMYYVSGYLEINDVVINFFNRQSYIKSPCQGVFYSDYQAGDKVSEGDTIGFITDIFGKWLQDVTAPASGVILYKTGTPPVNEGETMVCIGYRQ